MSKAKLIREDLGISQIELSIEAEVPRYKIQLIDQNIQCLTEDEAERIAIALGRNPDKIPQWLSSLIKEDRWTPY